MKIISRSCDDEDFFSITRLIKRCKSAPQTESPPAMLMLMIFAGLGLSGTPGTGSPADHAIASNKSTRDMLHAPNKRIGSILADGFTP